MTKLTLVSYNAIQLVYIAEIFPTALRSRATASKITLDAPIYRFGNIPLTNNCSLRLHGNRRWSLVQPAVSHGIHCYWVEVLCSLRGLRRGGRLLLLRFLSVRQPHCFCVSEFGWLIPPLQ